jgi:hypothetical protein
LVDSLGSGPSVLYGRAGSSPASSTQSRHLIFVLHALDANCDFHWFSLGFVFVLTSGPSAKPREASFGVSIFSMDRGLIEAQI